MTNWNGNSGPGTASPSSPAVLRSLGPIVATAIVVLFLLVSAIPLMHWFAEEGRQSSLEENRDLWANLEIASYRLKLEYRLPGQGSTTTTEIVVRDAEALPAFEGVSAPPVDSVEALFDFLDEVIRSAPDSLLIDYDEAYGFPRSVSVDPESGLSGDETILTVIGFDPRTNPPPGEAP